jgi:hypothetical protein
MFRVHVGYTGTGRDRWRVFDSLKDAKEFCERVFARTGTVLTIEGVG